jgi:hypothetical protein
MDSEWEVVVAGARCVVTGVHKHHKNERKRQAGAYLAGRSRRLGQYGSGGGEWRQEMEWAIVIFRVVVVPSMRIVVVGSGPGPGSSSWGGKREVEKSS